MDKKLFIQIYIFFIIWKKTQSNYEEGYNIFEKKYNRNLSIILPLNNEKNIHLHHWIYLLFIAKKYKKNKVIKSICMSGIIQGLMYKDCFNIIKDKKNKKLFLKKIY
jgi:hypothetical protein